MLHSQFRLLATRRFLPLFITQALGAFNDNVFKNALVILITYSLAAQAELNAQLMVTAAAGIFILPFFLFSATAGQLADRYDKAYLIRIFKLTELILMLLAAVGFYVQSPGFLMLMLFLMGSQSTFFGPLKYSILPDHLEDDELISGNALIEAATFLAILLGTVVGGILILTSYGAHVISVVIIGAALAGWYSSRYIPETAPAEPDLKVNPNFVVETWNIVKASAEHRDVFLSILAISWFWLVGATFLAQFPTFGKDVLGGTENVVTFLLIVFSLGIGLGSLLCNRMLKGEIHATYVPLGALGITLFSVDLFFASQVGVAGGGELIGVGQFLSGFPGWRITLDLLLIAISGGLYIVPLYAIVQERSEEARRSRNIASNNILNALFMVVSALGTALMLDLGFTIPEVFLTIAVLNGGVAIYITRLLPGALVKAFIAWLLEMLYGVEVDGLRHFHKAGDKVLIVANHQSYLDALLIAAYVPDNLTFAINTYVARNRLIKFFLSLTETFPLDPANPLSTRSLIKTIKDKNDKVVLFPEGRITVTGALMKVYEGAGLIADKSEATILPVRIEGAQYSPFSRLKGKVRVRLFPRIRVTFMAPCTFDVPEQLKGRARRRYAGEKLYDLMTDMVFESSNYRKTLFYALLDARDTHGGSHTVLEDVERRPLHYGRLVTGCFVLGREMAKKSRPGEHVGVLLPNSSATAVTFFGLQAYGRVPAMLNFSTGAKNVASGCSTAQIRTVFSSRRFIRMGKLEKTVEAVEETGARLVYLEDLREGISAWGKLLGVIASRAPRLAYRFCDRLRDPGSSAVILFTSGTEGAPKGVVLSHVNIQANRYQVSSRIDFGPTDIVFNALPMFHSFGLTCGTLLPLLSGIKVFMYPSPLHYRIVPELVYDSNATIMFGTDTFLAGYARFANPYDFYSIRYAFAGAEKLKDETRNQWAQRFGVRVFEGYGATETAPVLTMNTPMHNQPGAVGRLMPAIQYRLEPMPGIDEGGRFWVSGPNIMRGYLLADKPGELRPPEEGWYDTGDIVELDEAGFVYIKGRAKRFAKVGGEMISLAAVESMVSRLWPAQGHVVVNLPEERKGEQLILLTEKTDASRDELAAFAKSEGLSALNVPRTLIPVDRIPLLGTGKTDFVTATKIAQEQVG